MSVRALRTRTEALLRDLEQVSYVHVDDEALDELIDVLTSHGGVLPRFTKVVQALEAEQVTRSRTQVTDLLSHLPTRPTSEKIRASDPAAPDTAGNPDNDDEHLTFKNEHGLDLDSIDRFLA